MRRKARFSLALVSVLVIALTLPGCAALQRIGSGVGGIFRPNHQNDYAEMHLKLERDAVAYDAAIHRIVDDTNTRREGVITDPQWNLFQAGVTNVRTLNQAVKADMDEWGATGVRPAMLAPHVKALEDAQNEVIRLVAEVKP